MKNSFPGHYRPNEDQLNVLWQNCVFVLDANVLLHLYRYTPNTRQGLQRILEQVKDRLWVPHQAALEYQSNRLNVIMRQVEAYTEVSDFFDKTKSQLENKLNSFRRHPYIDVNALSRQIEKVFSKISRDLATTEEEHPDLLVNDSLRDEVTELLEGKIGNSYREDQLKELYVEGDNRYSKKIPPGYKDSEQKSEPEKYGDFILWCQIIDKAKEVNKPVVLVTDDTKEDWWWKFKGRTIGPRPELAEEMLAKANVSFYMYKSDQFMEFARKNLKQQVEQNAIDEIRSIRRHEEVKYSILNMEKELSHTIARQRQLENERDYLEHEIAKIKQEAQVGSIQIQEINRNIEEIARLSADTTNMQDDERIRSETYLRNLLEKQKYLESALARKEHFESRLKEMEIKAEYLKGMQEEVLFKRKNLEEHFTKLAFEINIPNKKMKADE